MAVNYANHGILLQETVPSSQTYNYTVTAIVENEPIGVLSVDGRTVVGGGATIQFNQNSQLLTYTSDAFVCTDVDGVVWTIQNELNSSNRYELWLTHGDTRYQYKGASDTPHTYAVSIRLSASDYNIETNTYRGRPVYTSEPGYADYYIGCTVELTPYSMPQAKRTFMVTESRT